MTEPDQARQSPQLTVLSALAHGGRPGRTQVLDALLAAYSAIDEVHASLYHDLMLTALPAAARRYLEEHMAIGTYQYQSDFARGYFSQGEAKGETSALLEVTDARGIEVTDDARTLITECTDVNQLKTWVRRAATATSIDDLFD